jgi:hypothetical protein
VLAPSIALRVLPRHHHSSTSSPPVATEQTTHALPTCNRASSVALIALCPRMHARVSEHGQVLATTPCHPIHSQCHAYKRTPCLAFYPCRRPPVCSGEFAITDSIFFAAAIVDNSAHPFSLPVHRSQGTARAQSYSPSHWAPTFTDVELWRRRPCR